MAHNNGCNNIASPQSEQSAEEHITNHSPKEKSGKGEFAFEKALLGEGGRKNKGNGLPGVVGIIRML